VRRVRTHTQPHERLRHVVTKPKVNAHVKGASVVKINNVPTAAAATNPPDATRRPLVIVGLGLSALLFMLVLAIPATGARFTATGRVLMDHQLGLVLMGAAVLVLTALLFAATGTG
jgi:hypothetical protein